MKIGIIYRFGLSPVVFPTIEESIKEKAGFNLISSKRIRNEFLTTNNKLAQTINRYIDEGKLIPEELWVPFFTSIWDDKKDNIFCGLFTQLFQFKLFEEHLKEKNLKINFIKYYQIQNIGKVREYAQEKYSKLYKNSPLLEEKITEFNKQIESICQYAKDKYHLEYLDYFDDPIEILNNNKI